MIQLLFFVIFAEGVMAFFLLVKIGPLRELVIRNLDQVKMGKGPATVKTIAGTMFVILLSNLMNIVKIQNKGAKLGTMSPMDQVLWRSHLLEASLIGFTLFLGFLIDRVHHFLQKLINFRSNAGSSKDELANLKNEIISLKKKEEKSSEEIKQLSEGLKKMKLESEEKDKIIETAEAHVASLQKQAADLLLEYDRLLEDNQNLQAQTLRH
ncbi:hypothetical protein TanjilG_23982 [Lupinus angustifolius]|uniref:Endoplasmic reticulum transmembrane protein n=1 Tax=Lupinus angustifolius TaxID=3871 RepID=A0A1J7HE32_LUPAN|nr:PREDICTED: uncharacterized protein LOC109363408 [Lupinus angustifolius]XP_019465208.1 PREDICTED: uncharacterized protein LOC109363408 [Lupinus angustifolius]OIV98690.1 hypothetical protein TanjilG_23982 [Lupinus angustifolius]